MKPTLTSVDLKVSATSDQLSFGDILTIDFQRTLRIPDDGSVYPLPPGLGNFPICRVDDYATTVPKSWLERGGIFIPMYQREALWLNFTAAEHLPCAVKIAAGKINAVSGQPWDIELSPDGPSADSITDFATDEGEDLPEECDYIVVPEQPWLDGFNVGQGAVRQFVAMPLGLGYTAEGQLTGKENHGGLQIAVYGPTPALLKELSELEIVKMDYQMAFSPEMGLAAGGQMKQKIYPDPHGYEYWDQDNSVCTYVHIINSMAYREITGQEPPSTPISAATYGKYGLPWFALYDEDRREIAAADKLKQIKSVAEMDQQKFGQSLQDDETVEVKSVVKLKAGKPVGGGNW